MSGIAIDQPDWNDVLRRARTHGRRRHALEAVAAVALVVVGVASAYALGHPVVDFDKAPHAGLREVKFFGSLQVESPPSMDPGVLPREARRVATFPFGGKALVLYVAPTVNDGYCYRWTGILGGGCSGGQHAQTGDFGVGFQRVPVAGRSVVTGLEGSFADPRVARFVVGFADGTSVDARFVWVTSPIDTGFFAYGAPERRTLANRIAWFELLDAHGRVVHRETIGAPRVRKVETHRVAGVGRVTVPPGGIWSERRVVFDERDARGRPVYLIAMPGPHGRRCFSASTTFGCVSTGLFLDDALVCCEVARGAVRVEARFQDGAAIELKPRDGYLIWPIPASQWSPGHRIYALVELDAAGRAVGHGTVPDPSDQRGHYPCARPRSYGYGVKMCP